MQTAPLRTVVRLSVRLQVVRLQAVVKLVLRYQQLLGWHTLTILPPVIGVGSGRGAEIEKRPASNDEAQWPHNGVRFAMPGAAILLWLAGTRLRRTDRSFAELHILRVSAGQTWQSETWSAAVDDAVCGRVKARLPMASLLEIEIWGTVVHCPGGGRLARTRTTPPISISRPRSACFCCLAVAAIRLWHKFFSHCNERAAPACPCWTLGSEWASALDYR